jgi:hypothetical protein
VQVTPSPTATPDDAYADAWRPLEADPGRLAFLVGCQRSGTTLLHLELARSGAFRYLSADDVVAYDRLVDDAHRGAREQRRRAFVEGLDASDRGIDGIPAGPDTPEEYGLVIRRGELRYGSPDTTAATLPRLRELCAKKALLEGRERPLLLKSPPDYADGILPLAHAWPAARFVAIHRHPLRTLRSQVRAWRQLLRRRNGYLWLIDAGYRALFDDTPRRMQLGLLLHSRAGVEWLADVILRAHQRYLTVEADAALAGRALAVRYEELCDDPATTFARIADHLGVDVARPSFRAAPRDDPPSADELGAFEARRNAFGPYLRRFGYQPDVPR